MYRFYNSYRVLEEKVCVKQRISHIQRLKCNTKRLYLSACAFLDSLTCFMSSPVCCEPPCASAGDDDVKQQTSRMCLFSTLEASKNMNKIIKTRAGLIVSDGLCLFPSALKSTGEVKSQIHPPVGCDWVRLPASQEVTSVNLQSDGGSHQQVRSIPICLSRLICGKEHKNNISPSFCIFISIYIIHTDKMTPLNIIHALTKKTAFNQL